MVKNCLLCQKFQLFPFSINFQDLVPCILVTFEKEQIVVWRGNDYKPLDSGCFLTVRGSFDDDEANGNTNRVGEDDDDDDFDDDYSDGANDQ